MRPLDQFKTLIAKVAGTRPSSGCERAAHESNVTRDPSPHNPRAATTPPTARDGEKPTRPSGSYPAVWPR
jgi:hypothetical protein